MGYTIPFLVHLAKTLPAATFTIFEQEFKKGECLVLDHIYTYNYSGGNITVNVYLNDGSSDVLVYVLTNATATVKHDDVRIVCQGPVSVRVALIVASAGYAQLALEGRLLERYVVYKV